MAIADYGSLRRAADVPAMSQTALSHRLKRLQADLGAPLLHRSCREVSLTPAGRDPLAQALRLLGDLREAWGKVRVRGRRSLGPLSFASLPAITNSLLPGALAALVRERPDLAVHLHDVLVHMIAERVAAGAAAFGLTIVSAHLADLQVGPLVAKDSVLRVPADHAFAGRGTIDRAALVGEPMARISPRSKNRDLVDVGLEKDRGSILWK